MTLGPVLYKCDYCGWQTRKEREDLICPDCGRTLARFAMNLDEPGNFLTEEVFEKFPCVLAHEYRRLCYLARAENIYGVFLQLKDVIEVIIKLPVLIGMSWGKKYDVEGRSAYEKKLSKEKIALGVWVETADAIKKLFSNSSIRNTEKALPQPVWSILKDLHEWVVNNELTEWRNLQLAHGALALEDNDDFKQDMIRKIRAVTAFVERKKEELSKIVIMSDGKELIGSSSARNLPMFSGSCEIKVNDDIIPAAPFIVHYNYGIFFYDELLSDTYSRVLSYPMGRAERYHDDDISLLYKLKSGKTISSENDAESEFVTKTELDFVNRVACKNDFVEPEYISNWLRDFLNDNKSGIFLLEMERGCGKSYYTEMLNRRHMNHIDLVNDLDVRTYHISWSQNREINEFIEGIESEWCFAYEKTPDEDLAYSAHIVYDHDDPRNNAAALCRYLEKVRDYTSRSDSRQRKERIMLVLDGMDEISETNDHIWSFIPKPTMLPEGVYILLTGRIPDEENISKNYAKRINSIELTRRETVRSNNPNNVEQLRKYIHIACAGSVNSEIEDKIIDYAECRFLPMRMLCNNLNYNQSINLSTKDIKSMIASYVDWIINLYGDCRKEMIITFLSILSLRDGTVRFTLREIADLLNMGGIKWELIGLLSDISPMLMIYRNHTLYGKSYFAENSYQLINKDVADSIKEYLGDEKYTGVCFSIMKNAVDTLRDIDLNSRPDGRLVIMSDLIELCQEIGKNEWLLEQIPNICRDFVDKEKQVPDILNSKTEIVDGKTHYLLRTICSRICNLYHKNVKDFLDCPPTAPSFCH